MPEETLHERFKPMTKSGHENIILADNILPYSPSIITLGQFLKNVMEMI